MRRVIVALVIGLAAGYAWGYRDGDGNHGTVVTQTLEKFGLSRIKNAQASRERRAEEAARP